MLIIMMHPVPVGVVEVDEQTGVLRVVLGTLHLLLRHRVEMEVMEQDQEQLPVEAEVVVRLMKARMPPPPRLEQEVTEPQTLYEIIHQLLMLEEEEEAEQ